jgi:hypothetical protein
MTLFIGLLIAAGIAGAIFLARNILESASRP